MNDEADPLIISTQRTVSHSSEPSVGSLGDPAILSANFRPKWKTKVSFCLVLFTETLERIAFYGIVCNLVLFLNSRPLLWTSYNAIDALFVLNGISYVFAIFGGWLADVCLGKFRTIVLFFIIYIIGFGFWPLLYPYPFRDNESEIVPKWCSFNSTKSPHNSSSLLRWISNEVERLSSTELPPVSWYSESCAWAVYVAIAIIGVGYGAVRANIIPFGAHQFEHEGRTAVRVYFNWFYWSINIGALLAYGVLGYVQQELSYFWGYIAPLVVLCIAFFTFLSGVCIFVKRSASGSVITNVLSVCKESLIICCRRRRRRDVEVLNTDIGQVPDRAPCCLDYARARYGGSFTDTAVDDIKQLGKIILVFIAMIPYWTVYYQMQTTFVVQGLHMQLDFDKNDTMEAAYERNFTIPAAWLSLFNVIFVLILLPVLDRIVYPILDRAQKSPSLRMRIMIGMCCAVLAMISAGILEHFRLARYWEGGTNHTHFQIVGNTMYYAARMSVIYQLPQYAIIGISELFASIAGLELAYIYSPRSMQGIIMGLYWFSQGLGSLLGTVIMSNFKGIWFTVWDYGDINCQSSPFTDPSSNCHLDYYFYFLAGVQVVGIVLFVIVSWALDIGSKVPLRIQMEGQTVVRPADESESGASTRSPSPYVQQRPGATNRRSNSRTEDDRNLWSVD